MRNVIFRVTVTIVNKIVSYLDSRSIRKANPHSRIRIFLPDNQLIHRSLPLFSLYNIILPILLYTRDIYVQLIDSMSDNTYHFRSFLAFPFPFFFLPPPPSGIKQKSTRNNSIRDSQIKLNLSNKSREIIPRSNQTPNQTDRLFDRGEEHA